MGETFRIAVTARIRHGVLYEAIKKRGWNNRQAAEFLGISQNRMGQILNLKSLPPFIFTEKKSAAFKEKSRVLAEKLMELTGLSVEDLFPTDVLTDEFLKRTKTIEGIRDVPKQTLLGSGAVPQMLPSPDDSLIEQEAFDELLLMVDELPDQQRIAVKGLYFEGKTAKEIGEEIGNQPQAVSAMALKGLRYLEGRIGRRRAIEGKFPWLDHNLIKGKVNF